MDFGVAEHWVGNGVVVAVWGDLDLATAPKLADAIEAVARKKPAALIVDLSRVDFLASAGMTVLITAHREIAPSARFGVVADGPSTGRPLKMIGIDTIVDVYRTLDEALDEFAPS
ncbi:anti-anti-sigma factor [Mycolicibacterium tusciae]|uniref:Anti-sigma factor antagonist n=1 Tax=Mycolicibacterium tusciae TaxID=75922 RepID=A0A1X0JUR9_9MYCO|nr:anti-anti-sigma factor [Mycolicibacterium tusciae]